MRSVLILGNYRPSYILARTFHMRGYRVICDMEGYEFGAEMSRHVHALWPHEPFASDPRGFQATLAHFLDQNPDIEWVCPVTEPLIKAFAADQLSLPSSCKLLSVDGDLVQRCLDKKLMLSLADELDIPVAPFAVTSSEEELLVEAEKIGFPLVVRPQSSSHRLAGQKAVTIDSLEALQAGFESWKDETTDLLIQRHASGKRDNIYFAARDGVIERYLHAKIVRTDQADGSGLAVEGETIAPCPNLRGQSERLIKALNYSGIGCVQYLVDPETGETCFLELNPRVAGNHALPDRCGLGLGDWFIDYVGGTDERSVKVFDKHLSYSWLAGELEGIKQNVRRKRLGLGQALAGYGQAIKAYRHADMDIALSRDDWKPGLWTLLDSIPFLCRLSRLRLISGRLQGWLLGKEILS